MPEGTSCITELKISPIEEKDEPKVLPSTKDSSISKELSEDHEDGISGDECSSQCTDHPQSPPPDGGYGWLVLFGTFLTTLLMGGLPYCWYV